MWFVFVSKSDEAIQQELNQAKAQCLDAQRAEKLTKVDFQQLERRVSEKGWDMHTGEKRLLTKLHFINQNAPVNYIFEMSPLLSECNYRLAIQSSSCM